MATLRQYNHGTVFTQGSTANNAVTFTTTSSYNIDSVVLPLFREGSPGTLTVSIYATSSGLPSGSPLTSGTYNGNSLSDSFDSPTIATISVTPYLLAASTQYAIVTKTNTGYPNYVNWLMSSTSAYPDGVSYYNFGGWTVSPYDYIFETYGDLYAPTVTTQSVTTIASTTATGRGNVTSDGGDTVTERGVCWSTSSTPTTAGSKATASGTTGAFTASITGLSPSTLYYVRAYAINSVGTSYGSQVTFTTSAQNITFGEYIGAGSATTKLLLHLNGNSTDSSGNGNNGTDTAITYVDGKFGQGAGFNGSTSVIQTPFTGMASGMVSVFLSLPLTSAENAFFVVNQNTTGSDNYFSFIVKSDGKILLYRAEGLNYTTTNSVISANKNHNIIITQTGSLITIYVDGSVVATTSSSDWFNSVSGANQYCIGALKRGTQIYSQTTGAIDEVIIENRAWTASEIKKYYTNSLGRF